MAFPRPYGRYILDERIAMGGMAEIFRARTASAGFEKKVCIKRVLPHYLEDEDFVTMFRDEARTAAKLQHANVVQVFDFGEVDDDSGTTLFLAMELVEGADLRRVLDHSRKKKIPFELGEVVQLGIDVCRGLHHAHSLQENGKPLGIVHRDVSPHNIMVSRQGEVKVTDFGIAKAAERATHTSTGIVKGKVAYMSPEQAEGKHFDHRLDQWAVGVVLWEMLCGERLFKGENDATILRKVMNVEVPAPSSMRNDVPSALEEIILRALSGEPDDRFANLRQMELALSRFLFSGVVDPSTAEVRNVFPRIVDAGGEQQVKRTNVMPVAAISEPAPSSSPSSSSSLPPSAQSLPTVGPPTAAPRTERLEDIANISSTSPEPHSSMSALSSLSLATSAGSSEESQVFVSSEKLIAAPGGAPLGNVPGHRSGPSSPAPAAPSAPTMMTDDPRMLEEAAVAFEKQRSSSSKRNLKAPGNDVDVQQQREPSRRSAPAPVTVVADGMLAEEADRVMNAQAGDDGTPATRTLVPAEKSAKSAPSPAAATALSSPSPPVSPLAESPKSRAPLFAAAGILGVGVIIAVAIVASGGEGAPSAASTTTTPTPAIAATTTPTPAAAPSTAPSTPPSTPPSTTVPTAPATTPTPTPMTTPPVEPTPVEATPVETPPPVVAEAPVTPTPTPTLAAAPKAERPEKAAERSQPPGSVYVDVPGSWANVYIGKKLIGQTPTTLKLAPGRYNITLQNDETGKKRTVPLTVVSGAKTQINDPL